MPASQGRFFVTRFTTPGMAYFSNSFTFHNRTDLVFSVTKCIENMRLCGEWVKPKIFKNWFFKVNLVPKCSPLEGHLLSKFESERGDFN